MTDEIHHRIRKVTVSTGIITTIAGNGGTGSFSGDNGQASAATLYYPHGVAVDSSGISILISLSFLITYSTTQVTYTLLIVVTIVFAR